MQTTQSPEAGERTQEESTIDPVYGFLNSLRDCTFHFGKDQHELTIKAPDGGKIGLPFVEEMKVLTASRAERLARMAAPDLLKALVELIEASKTPSRWETQLPDARINAIIAVRLAQKGPIAAK